MKRFHIFFGMIVFGERFVDVKIRYYMEHAVYFGTRGDVEKALRYCNKALELDADNFYALLGLAAALIQKKEIVASLEYANRALLSKTGNVPAHSREMLDALLVVIFEMSGNDASLEAPMNRLAARYGGNLASVHAQLARTYLDLGIRAKAECHYEEVIKLRPTESAAYYNLGVIYSADHKLEPARQRLLEALELAENAKKRKAILKQLGALERTGPNGDASL